ncbi:MAG: hypothetical protein NTV94_02750 [Planctomycetota bacterium]|nr:hypothetical protein [Planctomycetota bacterium]
MPPADQLADHPVEHHVSPARWYIAASCVIVAAIAMRASVQFSAVLPPGIDAAYYPLQARSVLETGRLAYHDLPLIFWIDAALAKALIIAGSMDIDAAVLLASKVVDSLLQPFAAAFLFALGYVWAQPFRKSTAALVASVSCATLATLSAPMLRMTGDFEKNSLGLVWLVAAAFCTFKALDRGGVRWWSTLLLTVFLAALTHVAVLGSVVLMVGISLAAQVIGSRRYSIRQILGLMLAACAVGAVLLGLVYLASPNRAAALLNAPQKLLGINAGGEQQRGGPPGGMRLDPQVLGIAAVTYLAVAWGLYRLWKDRSTTSPARQSVVIGASAITMLLACPLLSGEYAMRLSLMAIVPASIVLLHALLSHVQLGKRVWPAPLIALGSLASVAIGLGWIALPLPGPSRGGPPGSGRPMGPPPNGDMAFDFGGPPGMMDAPGMGPPPGGGGPRGGGPRRGGPPQGMMSKVVDDASAEEFRSLRAMITEPATTVVIARHGLQWWAGYFMKVPVREERVSQEAIAKYTRVLRLEQKQGAGGPRRGGGGPPGGFEGEDLFGGDQSSEKLLHDGKYFTLREVRSAAATVGNDGDGRNAAPSPE